MFWMTDSMLDKNKIWKLVFFLDEAWFTLSTNIHSQSNKYWCYGNSSKVHEVPLYDRKVRIWVWCALSMHKITGPFFSQRNKFQPIHSINSGTLIQGIKRKKRKCRPIHLLCKNWRTIVEKKLLMFQDKSSIMCREIFSEAVRPALKLEVSTLRLLYERR